MKGCANKSANSVAAKRAKEARRQMRVARYMKRDVKEEGVYAQLSASMKMSVEQK